MKKLIFLLSVLFFISCKEDKKVEPLATTFDLNVELLFKVGNQNLVTDSVKYQNANGDTFIVDIFKFYMANIKLIKDSSNFYLEPNSYRIIDPKNPSSLKFTIPNVPNGNYTGFQTSFGVDSVKNKTLDENTGALSSSNNNMAWTWATGYIFFKFEGFWLDSGNRTGITYHVGGDLNYVTSPIITTTFSENKKTLKLNVDVLQLFQSPNLINFARIPISIVDPAIAKPFSENYTYMLSPGN